VNNVGVGRRAGAAGILLVTSGADDDGVVEGAPARSIKRPHIEDIDALHLSEYFETLDTGSLLEVGGDGAGRSTRANKVIDALDVYEQDVSASILNLAIACFWISTRSSKSMGHPSRTSIRGSIPARV
jgi:hypothetical protein